MNTRVIDANDIVGMCGTKVPIPGEIGSLSDPKDAVLKKALARVGQAVSREL